MVHLDEPPFLVVGTDVSAKYKGAFCEAKIQKISKTVKCKVQYSNGISTFVTDDAVKGQLKVGATVTITCSNKKKILRATIQKIRDCSQYTVVFDDGDVACLKRTALCLKSGKHFDASTSLDQLPLTHPEHIGVTPVRTTIVQGRRSQTHKKSSRKSAEEESSAMEEKDIGKVICVEANDKKKVRDNWFPGLIVAPTSQSSVKTNVAEDYLVRSFKDGKYYRAPIKETTEFTKEIGARVENPTLKTAVEKALLFLDKDELPPHWDRDLLFGVNRICTAPDSEVFDGNNSDEESIEEKDHFVAQLFKFMDDRGTPLNQAPVINEKYVDLYKLFKVVSNCGGYKKANKGKLWKFVANKAGYEQQSFFSVKRCYQQYLLSFEEFYRKLGCTMLSHPRGVRSHSRFSRSLIRDVDKAHPSTSSVTDKNKCAKNELNDKKVKDSAVDKKTAKAIKAEAKLLKNNEETSKKGDKKKEDIPMVQLIQPGLLVENLIKIKKEVGTEKKKTQRNKKNDKEEKAASNDIIPTPIIENVPFDKNSPVIVGDNLVVYYGDKQATTYDAKVINVCEIEGVMKYYIHYKGWNSRYDEWIDVMRIAYKTKDPEPRPDADNDVDFSKSSPPEEKNVEPKKVPSTTNRTKRSATPLPSNLNIKKSPFISARPTRSCTLTDRPLFDIDISNSEEEYTGIVGPSKQYSRKKVRKSKPGVTIIKTELLDTDNQKRTLYPKTYPSKEVLMRQSALRKQKSSVFNVNSIKSEEVKVCEPVTLEPAFDINCVMQLPSDSIKLNEVNENVEAKNKSKIDNGIKIEPKIAPNHYLSAREKFERNYLEHNMSESSKSGNEEIRIKSKPLTISTLSEIASIIYYSLSSENEEENQLKRANDFISSPLDDKSNKSKISGTDFDLNKIRSEIKGLMPTSTNSNDIIQSTESFILDQQKEIGVSKINEPITDNVYEFKESESYNFNTISSVSEEKICRSIRHDSPKLFNFENSDELPKVPYSPAQEELVEQNWSMIPFVRDSNRFYSYDNYGKIKYENFNIINKIEDPTLKKPSENKSYESQNLESDITSNMTEIEQHFQYEDNLKYEVLDLCMKPPESPLTNIFSIPEQSELNAMISEEDDDDDDESKLVIAENDNKETDYQMNSYLVISEEHNSSNGQIDKNIEEQSLLSLPPSIHTNIELDCKSSSQVKKYISIPKDTDDESTTSCNESIQTPLIQSFQIYSNFENHSSQNGLKMDNIDDSTKSGFDSNSKLPTIKNREIIESATKLINEFNELNEPLINNKPKKCDFKAQNCKDKYEKEKIMVLPELQCREEIVDEDTLNNALVIEYNCKAAEYDIHKPSTSKSFFDSIHQPGTIKDSFYETNTSYDAKNGYFEATQVVKSVAFDTNVPGKQSYFNPNIPSCSSNYFYDHNIPSTSKSSFYENSWPSTSKSFYNPESDASSVLFCEETIPGSPTSTLDEQYDQEQRKKNLQALHEEREAASAIYAMNQSSCRPITLMGATEAEMEEYSNILQKYGTILDQHHLKFLAEISDKKLGINVNEPSVTEPLEREPETIVEKIVMPPEKLQSKRRISSHEKPSKRSKFSTTTAPIPPAGPVEKPVERYVRGVTPGPPIVDGKPMFVFTPEMDSKQRQALIITHIEIVQEQYAIARQGMDKIQKNKKNKKKKKEKAKAAKAAAIMDLSQAANGPSSSK